MRSQRAFSWQLRHSPQWQRPAARLDLTTRVSATGSTRAGTCTGGLLRTAVPSHSIALPGIVSQGSNSLVARPPRRRPDVERKALKAYSTSPKLANSKPVDVTDSLTIGTMNLLLPTR